MKCEFIYERALKETDKLKAASGNNPNSMFDNRGFVEPVISSELKGEAGSLTVSEVYEYDIDTKKGEEVIIIN